MKFKLTMVLCIGLIPMLFGIAFLADAAPKQSTGITYNATLLNVPDGSTANGINDAGQIVGETGTSGNQYGFIYELTQAPSVTLIRDGTASTAAYGINNAGQVVGSATFDAATAQYGFLYNGGNFTNFSAPSGVPRTVAMGINSTGQIVGYGGGVISPGGVEGPFQGFLYLGSTVEALNVPGATNTFPAGINSAGEIVGSWRNSTQGGGFIYKNGVYTVINVPGSTGTGLIAINDLGQIIGNYTDTNNNTAHLFIYENGNFDPITVLLGGASASGS